MIQAVIVLSFKVEFGIKDKSRRTAPATSGESLIEEIISRRIAEIDMQRYRSDVGKLLYLAESKPDLQNSTRELSKFTKRRMPAYEESMERAMI
jgi:hypothetical protein